MALEEYKSGRITSAELRRMLGFSTVHEIDGFLKDHGVFHDYTMEDLVRNFASLGVLTFSAARYQRYGAN